MSDRMLLATRKGLFGLTRKNGGWSIATTDFPGIAVSAVLRDPRVSSQRPLASDCWPIARRCRNCGREGLARQRPPTSVVGWIQVHPRSCFATRNHSGT